MSRILFCLFCLVISAVPAWAAPNVVVSIRPVHSLVSAVMDGVGQPTLLLTGNLSPHNASLKPSQARSLQNADLIFWIGSDLETFLTKPVQSLPSRALSIALIDIAGIQFPADDEEHDEGKHDDGHDDGHDDEPKHENGHKEEDHHEEHAHEEDHSDGEEHAENKHEDHDGHHHADGRDPHIWLDPANAIVILGEVVKQLSAIDPSNAGVYEANAKSMIRDLHQQDAELKVKMAKFSDEKYLTLHEGYAHFEHRYGLEGGTSLTINPDNKPGAAALTELKTKFQKTGLKCVFSEPQFNTGALDLVAEGLNASSGILDPLGSKFEEGPGLYEKMLNAVGDAFATCLTAK